MFSQHASARFFRAALAATFFAYVAVVFGAYARLSEAAFGCTDGFGCVGSSSSPPMTAREYQTLNVSGVPASARRPWKEMVQRYVAGGIGLMLIRLVALGMKLRRRKASQQVLIPLTTFVLVVVLTVLGVIAFEDRAKPVVAVAEILGGMTVLALLWWIALREQRAFPSAPRTPVTRALRLRTLAALVLVGAQITLGAWSMVNYAGLACPDFPTCQGSFVPPMNFIEGFTAWREIGARYENRLLSLEGATAIHVAHRAGAVIVLLYVGWLAFHLLRVGRERRLYRYGLLLMLMLSFTATLGAMEALAHLQLASSVAHNAVAALLLMSLVTLYHAVRAPRPRTSA